MEVPTETKQHVNVAKYASVDFDLAKKFTRNIQKELGEFLKGVVLFGSAVRTEKRVFTEHDIDVLMIVNDLTLVMSPEVIEAYRVITERVAADTSKRFHITTMKLTSFWEYVRNGDPLMINMLREGVPLFDSGFFEPVQQLLFQGRIRPTKESVYIYWARAPNTLRGADHQVLQACVDLYWAVVDAAHAALMHLGEIPPTPAEVSDMIEVRMVKLGLVSKKQAQTMQFFYDLNKRILHRQIQFVLGRDFDLYRKQAEEFVNEMRKIVERKDLARY